VTIEGGALPVNLSGTWTAETYCAAQLFAVTIMEGLAGGN
jgi:hypothetical protein